MDANRAVTMQDMLAGKGQFVTTLVRFLEDLNFENLHPFCVWHHTSPVEDKVVRRQALSLTYGRFFAEFLEDLSLVRLSLLDLNTCVGFRYGRHALKLRSFSWNRAPYSPSPRRAMLRFRSEYCVPDLPKTPPHGTDPNPIMGSRYNNPSLHRMHERSWNINHVSIGCGSRHPLRPD